MSTVRRRRSVAALALALLLPACAGPGGAGAAPAPAAEGPGRLVLQAELVGGFTTPEQLAGRPPLVSVYADGRIVALGAQIEIYPAPALPPLQQWTLERDEVRAVLDRAVAAGVTGSGDLGSPPIADAPATRFTLVTDAGTHVREVYALFDSPEAAGLTVEQQAAREQLAGLLDELTTPDLAFGAGEAEPYRPDEVAAVVRAEVPPDPELPQREVPWPGPALPGEPLEERLGLSCVVARGEQATAVLDAAAGANALTPWVGADGSRWTLTLRPLLPHETGCADLRAR